MKATTKLCCHFLTDAVTYISTQSTPGGIEAAINPILVALGLRLPFDSTPPVPIPNEALEELVLQLSDFSMTEQAGKRRASARASLIYHPAEPHQPQVHSALPIRILLICARPEDDSCGYIDHRLSALPLVEATEALPGQIELQILKEPTFAGLQTELDRARHANAPYHVVHFDGHGIYDPETGMGGLCFEYAGDVGQAGNRRHDLILPRK